MAERIFWTTFITVREFLIQVQKKCLHITISNERDAIESPFFRAEVEYERDSDETNTSK